MNNNIKNDMKNDMINDINTLNSDKLTIDNTVQFVNNIYDNLSYFDLYGNSVFIFILMTLFVFLVYSYCKVMQTKEDIAADWVNQRCKPQNIPFAGLITHPEDTTAFQYTNDNFQYCVQNILLNISESAVKPLNYMVSALAEIFSALSSAIQQIRIIINRLRDNLKKVGEDLMSRILNIMIPIQTMLIALMDIFGKIQGTMVSGLYTMLGTYFTLQSLMGAILELFVKLLLILVIIISGLWVMTFTWPAAASTSGVFLSISIPLTIIVLFMTEVLHIKTSGIPKLRCFDENTKIPLSNNINKCIKYINVGDQLKNGSYVTAKLTVTSEYMKIFKLNNIIVSESHLVQYGGQWIRVADHPSALLIDYDKPYLYCLNTSDKRIELNGLIFSDWDEITDNTVFLKLKTQNKNITVLENIHEYLDEGFTDSDLVQLKDGTKCIKDIRIGDVLEDLSAVYGLVEIDTSKLRNHNAEICKHKSNKSNKSNKIYHLLTTNGYFKINSNFTKDYNNLIDKFII